MESQLGNRMVYLAEIKNALMLQDSYLTQLVTLSSGCALKGCHKSLIREGIFNSVKRIR